MTDIKNTSNLESIILRAMIEYPKLLKMIGESTFPQTAFTTPVRSQLYNLLLLYYSNFDDKVDREIISSMANDAYGENESVMILRYYDTLSSKTVSNYEWVVSKLDELVKSIKLKDSIQKAQFKLDDGKLEDATNILVEGIRTGGIVRSTYENDLLMNSQEIMSLVSESDDLCFPSRIYTLDEMIGGIKRKELMVVMAASNVGKTWSLIHFTFSGLLDGKYILFITTEMDRSRILGRIWQNICGMYRNKDDLDYDQLVNVWDDNYTSMKEKMYRPSTLRVNKIEDKLKWFHTLSNGGLSVQHYPTGEVTTPKLKEIVEKFIVSFDRPPDCIFIDGLGDLGMDKRKDLRLGLAQNCRELRDITVEYNCAIVATHQATRNSFGKLSISAKDVSESIGIFQVSDTMLGLGQDEYYARDSKIRISIMKARNQEKFGMIDIWQNLKLGQFSQRDMIAKPPALVGP